MEQRANFFQDLATASDSRRPHCLAMLHRVADPAKSSITTSCSMCETHASHAGETEPGVTWLSRPPAGCGPAGSVALGAAITGFVVAVDTPAARVIAEAQGVTIRQPVVFVAQFVWHGRNLALGLPFALALPPVGLNSIVMLLRLPRPPWTAVPVGAAGFEMVGSDLSPKNSSAGGKAPSAACLTCGALAPNKVHAPLSQAMRGQRRLRVPGGYLSMHGLEEPRFPGAMLREGHDASKV